MVAVRGTWPTASHGLGDCRIDWESTILFSMSDCQTYVGTGTLRRLNRAVTGFLASMVVLAFPATERVLAEGFPGCSAVTVSERDLSRCDLRGAFSPVTAGDRWPYFNLEEKNLQGADLSGIRPLFQPSSMTPMEALMFGSYFVASFRGSDLTGANLAGTIITGDLRGATITGEVTIGAYPLAQGLDLGGATATFATFEQGLVGLPKRLPDGVAALPTMIKPPCEDKEEIGWRLVFLDGKRVRSCTLETRSISDGVWYPTYWVLIRGQSIHDLPNGWDSGLGGMQWDPTRALVGADLRNVDLSTSDLSGSDLTGADLTGANLANTNLAGVNAGGTSVPAPGSASAASVRRPGAKLFSARLTGARLTGAQLRYAGLAGVISGGIIGAPATLPKGWTLTAGYLVGPKSNLTNAFLNRTNLAGIDLSTATLSGVRSGGITGKPASLPARWILAGGYLIGPGSNLSGARLRNLDFKSASLAGANLANADLTGAKLKNVALAGVVGTGITGKPASLPSGWKLIGGKFVQG